MTTPHWTIDDDGELDWNGEGKITASISGEDKLPTLFEAKAALVRCARDADRLATLAYGLRDTHWDDDGHCHEDGFTYPCSTIRLINELAPEAPS